MPDKPRFIADIMLGSLAKWLRIMGFDTLYYRTIDDNDLIKAAKQEYRTLLTRDTGICMSKKVGDCLLIRSDNTLEQIREVLNAYAAIRGGDARPQRCSSCNGELLPVAKSAISDSVPEYVLLNAGAFLKCGECGKVYWDGSHKRMIDAVIADITDNTEAG